MTYVNMNSNGLFRGPIKMRIYWVSAQFEATLTAIKALQRQVEILNGKMDEVLERRE